MSPNVLFNKSSQKPSFKNTSNNFTLPILTNRNRETFTHSADSLNMMFSQSDQSCKNSNAVLNFEALISTSQYIDLSKLDDFVTRDVEAVIFQPLPLTKNEKTTVDLSSTKFVIYYNQKV